MTGAAHFGHPSSCTQLPITTDAQITLYTTPILYTLDRYQSPWAQDATTNHYGDAPNTQFWTPPHPLHTFLLSIATVAPITLLFAHPYPLPIYTGAHSSSLDTPILYQSTRVHTLLPTPPYSIHSPIHPAMLGQGFRLFV